MMKDAILGFFKQFGFQPVLMNGENLGKYEKFLVAGMGGSHFGADFIKALKPEADIIIHSDYGLPLPNLTKDRLVICSSYSGNTEEVLSAFQEAGKRQLPVVAVSVGGELLKTAKEAGTPYVEIPDTGIQPRSALGYSFLAFAKAMGMEDVLSEAIELEKIKAADFEKRGEELAQKLKGFVPLVYSSQRNNAIAFNWKIGFNETAKTPAFYNVFPELNHNEMTSFDFSDGNKDLAQKFCFVFLRDGDDYERIGKRMDITKNLYEKKRLKAVDLEMDGKTRLEKIFISSILADWTAYYLGLAYGVDTEQVPMVEELKKTMVKPQ